jgi:hypothetical protein
MEKWNHYISQQFARDYVRNVVVNNYTSIKNILHNLNNFISSFCKLHGAEDRPTQNRIIRPL